MRHVYLTKKYRLLTTKNNGGQDVVVRNVIVPTGFKNFFTKINLKVHNLCFLQKKFSSRTTPTKETIHARNKTLFEGLVGATKREPIP